MEYGGAVKKVLPSPNLIFVYSLISALILSLCFPKTDAGYLAWIALVPFFVAIYTSKNYKQALLNGLIFGSVFFLSVLFWITSLSAWVGFWGFAAWIALCLYLSIYMMIFSFFAYLLIKFSPRYIQITAIPLLWCALELARSIGEFASPAGTLAYTQYLNLPLIQSTRITGIYGISFLIVLANIVIASFIISKGNFMKRVVEFRNIIAVLAVILVMCYAYGFDSLKKITAEKNIDIVIVQPNFDQRFKLDPGSVYPMLDKLCDMTGAAKIKPGSFIIWPETAVAGYVENDKPLNKKISDTAIAKRSFLITGGFRFDKGNIYNSLFCFSPKGRIISTYDKEHLMPFGEYLPFRQILFPLLRRTGYFDVDQSPNENPALLQAGGTGIGAMICFESLFDNIARQRAKGADILLCVTNDAWFGESAGAYQHLSAAPFRAVENGKYFIQCANTGISAVVDPCGRFLKRSKLNTAEVISLELR